jgi:hypothetical protein
LELSKVPRCPSKFRQRDLTRALKAAIAAGIGIERFEIDNDGKIIVFTETAAHHSQAANGEPNEWDEVKWPASD